jgi:hypothetical protein
MSEPSANPARMIAALVVQEAARDELARSRAERIVAQAAEKEAAAQDARRAKLLSERSRLERQLSHLPTQHYRAGTVFKGILVALVVSYCLSAVFGPLFVSIGVINLHAGDSSWPAYVVGIPIGLGGWVTLIVRREHRLSLRKTAEVELQRIAGELSGVDSR